MCKYICIHYPHNLMYIYAHTHIYTYIYVHTHMIYLCVCTLMCIYAYTVLTNWYMCIYICIYIYIYIYIYIHIYTLTYVYKHVWYMWMCVHWCVCICLHSPQYLIASHDNQKRQPQPHPPSYTHTLLFWIPLLICMTSRKHSVCLHRYTVISAWIYCSFRAKTPTLGLFLHEGFKI